MKLMVHNMLTSNILKGVTKGFPLKIKAVKVENVSADYNRNFIVRILPRIEYDALRAAVKDVSFSLIKKKEKFFVFFCIAWFE
jgi:multifunctional methyltransferase subunit TRM112